MTDVPALSTSADVEAVAAQVEASTERLASDLCRSGHDREDGGHCQECYDIACSVMDTPWYGDLADRTSGGGALREFAEVIRLQVQWHDEFGDDRMFVERVREALRIHAARATRPAPDDQREGER